MSTELDKNELSEIVDFCLETSYEAGQILLKFQRKRNQLKILDKGSDGIATEADEKVEEFILDRLKNQFPDHTIISEEDHYKAQQNFDDCKKTKFTWLIDPLDGTNNFMNGIPIYCVSIGLLYYGKPVAGVVYNPSTGECYYASSGQGAYLIEFHLNPFKRKKLQKIKNTKEMSECIFSPAPDFELENKFESQLSVFRKNIIGARAVRRFGSAALELCYVANGNLDGYWEKSLKPWDVAASGVICQEAGILLTDFNGSAFNPFNESILAAPTPLHGKILEGLSLKRK